MGVVGRLHNFVNAVCISHKRREAFNEVQQEVNNELLYSFSTLELRQDGGIRWNSVYLMLLRCLELKTSINRFIRQQRELTDALDDPEDTEFNALHDRLSEDDWEDVKELVDFLQAPYEMTKRLEGNNSVSGFGSLWQTLPNLQALWAHYSDARDLTSSSYLTSAVSLGLEKLNTYFDTLIMTPDVSFYAIATLLHPKLRFNWFQSHWKNFPQWYKKARKSLEKVYNEYLAADAELDESQQLQLPPLTRRKLPSGSNYDDLYERTMAVDIHLLTNNNKKRQRRVGQLEEYFESLVTDLTTGSEKDLELLNNPWAWWLQIGRNRYPILFKIATDYLSIPSTSCDCERAFSSARRTISNDRNRLNAATIEAIQLQKGWLRQGVVRSSLKDLEALVQKSDKKSDLEVENSVLNFSFSST